MTQHLLPATIMLLLPQFPFAAPAQMPTDSTTAGADSIAMMNLDAVTVTARRPVAVTTADKISYTPSATLSAGGSNIHDTLASLPGVTINSHGSISVNGRQGVQITIDGRKSILSGDALNNYLKSLPASNVDRIEIITTPSAKNDAASASTTINIRLRRASDDGFTFGAGTDCRLWKAKRGLANIHAGYSNGSHRFSLTYAAMTARYPSSLITDRPYADTGMNISQHYFRHRKDFMHNVSANYDWRITPALTLGSSLAANLYTRKESASMHTCIPAADTPLLTDNATRFHTRNIYGNLYLRRTGPLPESDMTLNLDFFNYRNTERQAMDDNSGSDIDCDMGGSTSGYVGSLDVRHPLSGHWHLSGGIRASYVTMHNDGQYTGTSDVLGSTFGYRENINAIYAESRARYGHVTATVGLRMEQTNLSTTFTGNEATQRTDYTDHSVNLFPTLSLKYTAGNGNDMLLAYTRGITRPRYADLNPFIHIYDDITHIGGNINLRPSITHNIQAAWSHASWLRVSINAGYTSDAIVKCYREINRRLTYVSPENLPRHLSMSLGIAAVNISVTRRWRLSATGTLLYSNYHFPPLTGISPNCMFTPMCDIKNIFDFPHDLSAELSGSWRGRSVYGQARVSAVSQVYIGVRKSILGSHGSVTLYVRDLFNTNHPTSVIRLAGRQATVIEHEYEDMRLIGASLSLRFNSGRPQRHIQDKRNWTDEMNRVNLQP